MLKRNKSEIWEDDAGNRKNFYRIVSDTPQNETDTDDDNETKTLRTTMKNVTSTFTLEDWQNAVLEKEKEIRLVAGQFLLIFMDVLHLSRDWKKSFR